MELKLLPSSGHTMVIRKSEDKDREKKGDKKNHRHKHSKHKKHSASPIDSDDGSDEERARKNRSHQSSSHHAHCRRVGSDLEDELGKRGSREKRTTSYGSSDFKSRRDGDHDADRRPKPEESEGRSVAEGSHYRQDNSGGDRYESHSRHRNAVPKLSEEERTVRLLEMQKDAELHEEQRWKRLKKADAQAVKQDARSRGKSFLDAAHRSIYVAEKGGSSTIEESVRRRTHYSQRSEAAESNAFRR